ncbi:sulfotransferase family 2 domain-containing protein [Vibrio cyclitrophicus]|uniref:sulfotransferase family 2 domain-containing protein n=1 Tax=Vibrio cyclitrophicus TaxID=47951 RepID=UPI000C8308F3|nr:sulfotransferase family 2 domain-containing protein [Vibrio cyclitrophicus]PME52477.1 hypothetical protein BCV35_21505 [Vibrio cyclitrophicus]
MFIRLKAMLIKNATAERFFRYIHSKLPIFLRLHLSRKFMNSYQSLENENKVIFVHVPKAAGNGITYSLFDRPSSGHYFLSKYLDDSKAKFDDYFKFTVVRNPWDRFVSAFHYLNNDDGGIGVWDVEFRDLYLSDCKDFKSFVDKMIKDDNFKYKVIKWTHFIPQHTFLTLDGVMSLDNFDFICKFESINRDFDVLKSILGKENSSLAVVNKSSHSHYRDYFTEQYMVDFVRDLYKDDIELLEYDF